MADIKTDLTGQAAELIATEIYRAVAKLANRVAANIAQENTDPKISKRDIYLRVADEFNKVTEPLGTEVIATAVRGRVGGGPMIRVQTKEV